jgi:general secretion pathway protein K
MTRQRGFALLIVLWSMALLALIGTRLTANARGEAMIARNLEDAATAETAADGAVQTAILHLLAPADAHWAADGQSHLLRIGAAGVELRIASEAGRINPGLAPPPLLAALLHRLGSDPEAARALADAIVAYRMAGQAPPPGRAFDSLEELAAIPGLTPALRTALRPYLSPYAPAGIDLRFASPEVVAALGEAGLTPTREDDLRPTVAIAATATLADGARFRRRAVVRIAGLGAPRPWAILDWGQDDD